MQDVIEQLVTIATNNLFPMAMCLYLLKLNHELNMKHREDIDKLGDVIEANTLAINTLTERVTN